MSDFFELVEASVDLTQQNESLPIEFMQLAKDEKRVVDIAYTEIVVITAGSALISCDHFFSRKMKKGKIVLLPPGSHCVIQAETSVSACVFRVREIIKFDNDFTLQSLDKDYSEFIYNFDTLEMKPAIERMLSLLEYNIKNGVNNERYLKIKVEELFHLLRSYYTKEELVIFFCPLMSENASFANFVFQNYRNIRRANEFPKLYQCSTSCFEKKFRKTFGTSVYQWLKQKKINLLYHEINRTDKPLKQIAEEQGFHSLPQFNDFCKKYFGYPPGKLRKLASLF